MGRQRPDPQCLVDNVSLSGHKKEENQNHRPLYGAVESGLDIKSDK